MDHATFQKRLIGYLVGGAIALLLSVAAFMLVMMHGASGMAGALILLALAGAQAVAQMIFFLHLTSEKRPWWRSFSMIFTLFMLLILVAGSIWIMYHLDYNMEMTPQQMHDYMIEQNKKGF